MTRGVKLGLIVIDMDDTVYLECDYVRSGFHAVDRMITERFGVSEFFNSAWSHFERGERGDIFDRAIRELEVSIKIDELVTCYRNHTPDIGLTADSIRFIESMEQRVPLALITDGPPASQRSKIMALGLDSYLQETVVTYEHGPSWHKPGTPAFLHVQERFDMDPNACIYIADNPSKDFRAPAELGWRTLRIRRPGGLHFGVKSRVEEMSEFPDASWLQQNL